MVARSRRHLEIWLPRHRNRCRRRELKIANEESISFSRLVLATGSSALRLNLPGSDLQGVYTFRDTRDVDLLLALAAGKKRVVVVGGGLLGLEAAYGLAKAGAPGTPIP